MPLSTPPMKTFVAVFLLLYLVGGLVLVLCERATTRQGLGLRHRARMSSLRLRMRHLLLLMAVLCSLLLLSACGTAPSTVVIKRQVPAVLLVRPAAPTPLVPKAPASRSTTPGPTTEPTP